MARLNPDPLFQFVIILDQHRLVGAHNRIDAVLKSLGMGIFDSALIHLVPVVKFSLGHDVLGVGKRGLPLPVHQARIPADVIPVQMGTHNEVNLFRTHACRCQRRDEVRLELVEYGSQRAFLAISATGVDHDHVAACLDDIRMKTHLQHAIGRELTSGQVSLASRQHVLGQVRKEVSRGRIRALGISMLLTMCRMAMVRMYEPKNQLAT